MPQRRERPRPRESGRDDEVFIIIVHDIPRHCRWQELKDMTRNLGGEQSLKAEVFPVGNGMQMGHCTIKGRSDAVKVYDNLCTRGWNGHRVRVQLSALEKNGHLRTVEGPMESRGIPHAARTPSVPQQALQSVAATAHSESHPVYASSAHPLACLTYNPQYATMSGWPATMGAPSSAVISAPATSYASGICPSQQSYLPATAHPQVVAPASQYRAQHPSKGGSIPLSPISALPIRSINDGTTIFLSGLPYYQSESELRSLLRRFGGIIYLEIHPDSRNPGRNKGTARARYKTSSEALTAVRDLDGKYLRDRKISVKQERDEPSMTTTSSSRRPLRATKNSSSSSSKQKKNVAFSSGASNAKSHRPQEFFRGPSRVSDRSSGAGSPTRPLVVNGARKPPARRGGRGATSASHSDDSSEEDDSDKDSHTPSDDEDEMFARFKA